MADKKILQRLKNFDPELCKVLENALHRQISTLSLIPTDSAASPFSAYLKSSALGNDFIDYKSTEHHSSLERIAALRACELFKAEHAVVRLGNPAAASRVVFQIFAKSDDNTLLFNLRKREYCSGDQMQYYFIKFSLELDNFQKKFAAAFLFADGKSFGVGSGKKCAKIRRKARAGNLLVKAEVFMTSDEKISYDVLRLSALDPIREIGKIIQKMVENQPLFSDEWLPDAEATQEVDSELLMTAMVHWRL